MKCQKCDSEVAGKFCRRCGAPSAPLLRESCPSCGSTIRSQARFCPRCAAPQNRVNNAQSPFTGASIPVAPAKLPIPRAGVAPDMKRQLKKVIQPAVLAQRSLTPASSRSRAPEIPKENLTVPPPTFWFRNRGLLLGAAGVVALIGTGLTYWLVQRKAVAPNAPIVQGPQNSEPVPPANSSTPEAAPTGQATQAPASEPQEAAGVVRDHVAIAAPRANAQGMGGRSTPPPVPAPYAQAHQNAEEALLASRLLEPAEGSALFWARKAKSLGDPAADPIEQQVFDKQMASVHGAIQGHDYLRAQTEVSLLIRYFPERHDLLQMPDDIRQKQEMHNQQIEEDRKNAELEARTKRFQFRHRHVAPFLNNTGSNVSFCQGTLMVTPDGVVRYDCTNTGDPQGRCDHAVLPQGSLKEARLKADGSLHLASRQSGNYDFYGDTNVVQQALSAIAPLVRR